MVEVPTLHEASILWIVMHIAMTVKTGDQPSLPNMDAQICTAEVNDTRGGGRQHTLTCPFEYMCYRSKRIWVNEQREFGKDTNRMNRRFMSFVHDKLHCRGRYRIRVIEPEHQQELLSLQCGSILAVDWKAISLTCLVLAGPHHLNRKQPLLEIVSIDEVDAHRRACVNFCQLLV